MHRGERVGDFGYPLHYKGTKIIKVVKGRQLEGNDIHYDAKPGGVNIFFKEIFIYHQLSQKNNKTHKHFNINEVVVELVHGLSQRFHPSSSHQMVTIHVP